jgi:hypothetical protein
MKGNSTQNLLDEQPTLLFFGFKNQKNDEKKEKFLSLLIEFYRQ